MLKSSNLPILSLFKWLTILIHPKKFSYGFCISNNQYDSVQTRIWRKVDKKDKTEARLAEALILNEEQYHKNYEEIDSLTKIIRFKPARLNEGKEKNLPTPLSFRLAFIS